MSEFDDRTVRMRAIPADPAADEQPTTVIPVVKPGVAALSAEQTELLERLCGRAEAERTPKRGAGAIALRVVSCAVVFSLTLVLTAVAIAGGLYEKYNGQLHRVDVIQRHDPHIRQAARQQDAENFLVIGSDSRAGTNGEYGNETGARSDTTMIVHISPSHTKATIISIPRDSWVTIPTCKQGGTSTPEHKAMFNAAFAIGGPACTIATVQRLTGIAVTHFVEIDFKGFRAMVDAMHSVTVCSPRDVYDEGSKLRLHKGENKLDGAQALAYVRARESLGDGSDLGRIKRQQMFMGAVLRQAMSGSMLTNPGRLTKFLDAATKAITIDKGTSLGDLRELAGSLQGLDTSHVTFYTAPIANRDYSPPGTRLRGKVLLDAKQGRLLYDSVIEDRTPVWITDVNGKKVISTSKDGTPAPAATSSAAAGTTSRAGTNAPAPGGTSAGTGTPSPALPEANLNAAQETCSL